MEMALTGGEVSVRRLHELGLVNRLTPPGEAFKEATRLARAIAGNAPLAVVATKQVVSASGDWPAQERWRRQTAVARPIWSSDDAREGAVAFAERRPPQFTGS
jgi:enoyl-CoA hydratase